MQIFISHSSPDKPFVRRLKRELESRGLRVWLDEAEIRVGQSIPSEIGRAIETSDVLCVVISRASSGSAWVNRELNAFLPRTVNNSASLVPCRLDSSPLPALIADIKYADFTESFDSGLDHLVGAVRIKEELERCTHLQDIKQRLVATLTPGELVFFVHRFQRSSDYFIPDRREEPAPWKVLGKLLGLAILDETVDKYEVLFTLTALGEEVLDEVANMVSEEQLAELDRTVGPRNPKRVQRGRHTA